MFVGGRAVDPCMRIHDPPGSIPSSPHSTVAHNHNEPHECLNQPSTSTTTSTIIFKITGGAAGGVRLRALRLPPRRGLAQQARGDIHEHGWMHERSYYIYVCKIIIYCITYGPHLRAAHRPNKSHPSTHVYKWTRHPHPAARSWAWPRTSSAPTTSPSSSPPVRERNDGRAAGLRTDGDDASIKPHLHPTPMNPKPSEHNTPPHHSIPTHRPVRHAHHGREGRRLPPLRLHAPRGDHAPHIPRRGRPGVYRYKYVRVYYI